MDQYNRQGGFWLMVTVKLTVMAIAMMMIMGMGVMMVQ